MRNQDLPPFLGRAHLENCHKRRAMMESESCASFGFMFCGETGSKNTSKNKKVCQQRGICMS